MSHNMSHMSHNFQMGNSVYPIIFELYLSILKMCQEPSEFKKMNARFSADGKKTRYSTILDNTRLMSVQVDRGKSDKTWFSYFKPNS